MKNMGTHLKPLGASTPRLRDAAWLAQQYNNRALVPNHGEHLARWARVSADVLAAVATAEGAANLNRRYSARAPACVLDVFAAQPDGGLQGRASPLKPCVIFIHGGWWRALDKADHAFIAPAFTRQGVHVVVPNYTLCPTASIDDICLEMVEAVAWVWRQAPALGIDRRRIVVAGHSAGGHLAAMMLACRWPAWDAQLPARVVRAAVSVSGVFDLEPLRHTPFLQQDLKLTPASAKRLSPARLPMQAAPPGRLSLLVGGDESSEFHRQAALIAEAWGPKRVDAPVSLPGLNHFSVMDDLAREGSAAWQTVMLSLR